MPARKPPNPDAKPQIERFREAARELGCEDNEEAFWDKVVQVAKHKPKAHAITPEQGAEMDKLRGTPVVSWEPPQAMSRTKELVEAELADAEAALAGEVARWEAYSGNNPNKYKTDLRLAESRVASLKAELSRKS